MGPADAENRFPVGCVLGRRGGEGIALERPRPVQSTVHHHSCLLTQKKQKKSNDCLGGAVARVVMMGSRGLA